MGCDPWLVDPVVFSIGVLFGTVPGKGLANEALMKFLVKWVELRIPKLS